MSKRFDNTIIFVAITVFVFWYLPYFGWIQYPFRLLGTWFHEMGHGLTALFIGGDFNYLRIYENGSGVAYFSIRNSYLPLSLSSVLVAAGGLLGPAITGALLIASAKFHKSSMIALRILIALIVISLLLWIRSFWGIVVMSGFAIILFGITLFENRRLEVITILFLGLQSIVSTYFQFNYLFTKQFERNGVIQLSDTQVIAINTYGTYWMWAICIIIISTLLLWKGFQFYFKK